MARQRTYIVKHRHRKPYIKEPSNVPMYLCLAFLAFCFYLIHEGKQDRIRMELADQAYYQEQKILAEAKLPVPTIVSHNKIVPVKKPATKTVVAAKAVDQKELMCLAKNIFFEARGTDEKEMIRVINVTTNRVKDANFPKTYCQVVYDPSQFSWTLNLIVHNVPKIIKQQFSEQKAWEQAKIMANHELSYGYKDITHGALFYHTPYVNPRWARGNKLAMIMETDYHKYYRPRKQ